MESKKELRILLWIAAVFGVVFFLPIESARFNTAIEATLDLAKWYAREHVVLCLLPAFFIAGVIAVNGGVMLVVPVVVVVLVALSVNNEIVPCCL